ncbi:MAG: YlbF family regulator [Defluviitaleaceae bacterium]|nr:YlbF family regulator [Defluviitaleaceae bacterium]
MNVFFEKARELGRMILESEASLRLADARAALDADTAAKAALAELSNFQQSLQSAMDSEMSEGESRKALDRLTQLRGEMLKLPSAQDYLKAQEDFDTLLTTTVSILEGTAKGDTDTAEETGHKCGGCGGCPSHR